jgi:hypothetical protein
MVAQKYLYFCNKKYEIEQAYNLWFFIFIFFFLLLLLFYLFIYFFFEVNVM